MASRNTRTRSYSTGDPLADRYRQQTEDIRKQAEDTALANDLVNNAGYDPREVNDFRRRGGDVRTLVNRPKPMMTPEEMEVEDLKRKAEVTRLKRSINPVDETVHPITGQVFNRRVIDSGAVEETPQLNPAGVARYRPKIEAFEGTTEEGDKWAMDRDEFGAAKDYRVTKPHTDKIVKIKLADGRVVNTRQKITDEGIEHEEIPTTMAGNPIDFSKGERDVENSWIKGKERRNEKGEWVPDEKSFEVNDAVKKTHTHLSRSLTGKKNEILKLEESYRRYPTQDLKNELAIARGIQKNIEDKLSSYEDLIKEGAGEGALHKLRGFKEGEYPAVEKKPAAVPTGKAIKPLAKPEMHPKYDAAVQWLKANPNDPRAEDVRKKLGL